ADRAGVPEGVRRLLPLGEGVPQQQTSRGGQRASWGARTGPAGHAAGAALTQGLAFLGESVLAFGAFLRGRARFRVSELFLIMQECGPRALGIVSLISFLIRLITAFGGA